jgi:hypothetical protein
MNSRAPIVIGAIVVAAAIAGAAIYLRGEPPKPSVPPVAKSEPGAAVDDAITNDEERLAYVTQFVAMKALTVGAKAKPGDDAGVMAGLLEARGEIVNEGTRAVRSVRVVVFLKDASDEVIGTYIDDALDGRRLGPGESRAFTIDVPEKREYAGRFSHALR